MIRLFVTLFALLFVVALTLAGSFQPPAPTAADKAIDDAAKLLEKALADTKEPAERAKLEGAIAALRKPAAAPKAPRNDLVSDVVDNRKKYIGQTVTFEMTFLDDDFGRGLRSHVGRKTVFTAVDSKNKAKLMVNMKIPAGLEVPAAKQGEKLVVTFVLDGQSDATAVSITRP